jgi:hypothetical protein
MQIGVPSTSQGSNDVENVRFSAKTFIDKQTNEVSVTDGYGHRVIVFDADTGNYGRHCGTYRHKPDDIDLGNYNPDAPPAQQTPQSGALCRSVLRFLVLRLRPRE